MYLTFRNAHKLLRLWISMKHSNLKVTYNFGWTWLCCLGARFNWIMIFSQVLLINSETTSKSPVEISGMNVPSGDRKGAGCWTPVQRCWKTIYTSRACLKNIQNGISQVFEIEFLPSRAPDSLSPWTTLFAPSNTAASSAFFSSLVRFVNLTATVSPNRPLISSKDRPLVY